MRRKSHFDSSCADASCWYVQQFKQIGVAATTATIAGIRYGLLRRPSRLEINSLRSALTAAAASQKITRYPGKGKHQI